MWYIVSKVYRTTVTVIYRVLTFGCRDTLFVLLVLLPVDRSGGLRGDLLCGHSALCAGVDPHDWSWGCLWEGAGVRLGSPVWLHCRDHWSDGGLYHRLLSRTVSQNSRMRLVYYRIINIAYCPTKYTILKSMMGWNSFGSRTGWMLCLPLS